MCFGGKSSSPQPQTPPPPNAPTTFDYQAGNRAQSAADAAVRQRQSSTMLSQTQAPGGFGSELGTPTLNQPNLQGA